MGGSIGEESMLASEHLVIREITESDLDAVTLAAEEFYAESDHRGPLTPRPDKYKVMLQKYIGNPFVKSFLAFQDGELAGYIHIYCQDDVTDEFIGEMYQFYIRKQFRGTGAARQLVNAADQQFQKWNCFRAYSEVAHGAVSSGINEKLFCNLWAKFGYVPKGTVLMKEYF